MAAQMAEDVLAAGGRPLGPYTAAELSSDVGVIHGARAVFIDMQSGDAEMLQLANDMSAGDHVMAIMTSMPLLDTVYDLMADSQAHIIVGHDRAENIMALLSILRPVTQASHEDGGDSARELRHITQQVSAIAQRLAQLSGQPESPDYDSRMHEGRNGYRNEPAALENGLRSGKPVQPLEAGTIRNILRARQMRDRFFEGNLFADPAWDMLLDMTAAHLEEIQVSVSSLCIAACVPPTTALRWIKVMTEQGLFERRADAGDGRRVFIALSDDAFKAVQDYMQAIQEQGLAVL